MLPAGQNYSLYVSKIESLMKKRIITIFAFTLILFLLVNLQLSIFNEKSVYAQTGAPNVRSIPLPTGSGARALGQGGAFIAVADDATAASWNPAGLIRLEKPEFSIVGAFLTTDQDFSVSDNNDLGLGNALNNEDVSRWDVNFLSFAYPFRFLNKNFVAAINYHQALDFHMDLSLDQNVVERQSMFVFSEQIDFKSSGGIGSLSPAIAFSLLPELKIGLTLNIFDDEFFNSYGWKETTTGSGRGVLGGNLFTSAFRSKTSSSDYHGFNANIGVLWDVWKKDAKRLTFGAVYKSPYTARFDQEINFSSSNTTGIQLTIDENSRNKLDWPMSMGMGIGFRYTDSLSFSFDVTWTDWSEWVQKTKINGERLAESAWSNSRPIGGGSEHDEIDDTFAIRFGTEYLLYREKEIIALRGGLFYEPRPSIGSPTTFDRQGQPVDFDGNPTDVWGYSLGAGLTTGRFSLDAAYQFRFVRDMDGRDIGLPETSIDTTENMFFTSLIVYF